ncbi:MFS transporter [Paenibacillus durus]|uniref:MFS transporter n=1 Tax=Paenibacillus durus TaxID=44251 RepID=UPI00069370B7|nr:MFS transporter [Paenibacillus durus]
MKDRREFYDFFGIVLTLGTGSILVVSLLYVTIPLMPVLGSEFHASPGQTIWAGSAYGFAYAVGNLIIGIFSDRFHRKTILGIGLVTLALSTVAVGWSPTLAWLIILRIIQGLIAASFPTVALAYIGDVLSSRYRPIAISILSSSFLLSGILGQLYAQAIGNWLGWSGVFEILAISYLVIAFFINRLPAGELSHAELSLSHVIGRTIKLVTIPSLLVSFAVSATVLFSFVTMYSGLGTYVSERFHLHEQGLMWIRIGGIPGIVMSLFAGPLLKRFEAKRVFIAGLATAGIGLGVEALSGSLIPLVIASIIFVTGISIANPSIIVVIGQLGGESRGSALAINAFCAFVGASLGQLLAEYTKSFAVLCLILIMILFLSAITTWSCIPALRSRFVLDNR